jgi:uncharacterized Ntn-hydrolase superfamily protein
VTFALAARCLRTGAFGACAATADLAVGARVGHVEAGVGAILTQHRTDPRLGPRGLDLLRSGCDATETIAALVAPTPAARWRQLAAIDAAGGSAAFSGAEVVTTSAERHGPGCVAIGNMLASQDVPSAMLAAFTEDVGAPLAARLVRALEGGAAAGGETASTRSAVVLVALDPGMRLVDLRIDDDPEPIDALRRLWTAYQPWTDDLRLRALEPDRAQGDPEAAAADLAEGDDR